MVIINQQNEKIFFFQTIKQYTWIIAYAFWNYLHNWHSFGYTCINGRYFADLPSYFRGLNILKQPQKTNKFYARFFRLRLLQKNVRIYLHFLYIFSSLGKFFFLNKYGMFLPEKVYFARVWNDVLSLRKIWPNISIIHSDSFQFVAANEFISEIYSMRVFKSFLLLLGLWAKRRLSELPLAKVVERQSFHNTFKYFLDTFYRHL